MMRNMVIGERTRWLKVHREICRKFPHQEINFTNIVAMIVNIPRTTLI